jgi:hypothetical protein
MPGLKGAEAARELLRALAKVIKTTHQVLFQTVHHPQHSSIPGRQRQLSDTLEHMGEVRAEERLSRQSRECR